jgi:hypothetical protein
MLDPPVRAIVIGAALWLVLGIGAGFVVLARLGEYGSVLQLLVGAVAGALGAVSHAILCLFRPFQALGFLRRALLNWLCAYVPFAALALLLTNIRTASYNPKFWTEALWFLVFYTGGPMLLVAALVALLASTRR